MDGDAEGHGENTKCPFCGSPAVYKYGKTARRYQRYVCLMCNRQFLPGRQRYYPGTRPDCHACGAKTHVFKRRKDGMVVFRCSRYPQCRTYVTVRVEAGDST